VEFLSRDLPEVATQMGRFVAGRWPTARAGSSRKFRLGAQRPGAHFDRVSLNRCEDALLSYLRNHPDETRFWMARVLEIDSAPGTKDSRASLLDQELRTYVAERARADPSLIETIGAGTVSMRNFAEYLFAVWTPPREPTPRNRQRRG